MMDDETLQMYVEESREHLADIESDLLAIEQCGADIDEDLVNKVFRAAHSIKGGAGFMGLDNIKELSHKMENVLGMIRSREMVPNAESINILLLAADALSNLLDDVSSSNDVDVSEHIRALIMLTEVSLPEGEKDSVSNKISICLPRGKPVFTVAQYDIAKAKKGGKFVYLAEYDLIHDVHQKAKTPLDIIRDLEKSGQILESKIDVEAIGTLTEGEGSNRLPFMVLFATILDSKLVNALFQIEEEHIYQVADDLTLRPIVEPLPEEGVQAALPADSGSQRPQAQTHDSPTSLVDKPEEPALTVGCAASTQAPARHSSKAKTGPESDTCLRVNVGVLDSLMNLAGELVLGRNQLLQAIVLGDMHAVKTAGQRLDLITSELQGAIMRTRMQPIGNIFNKFTRVVRDLARDLEKEVALIVEGKEVELDKTIIEGLSDPLTHLVRNAVDHGIEPPRARVRAGKKAEGQLVLRAYHEAGQVNIEIIDDGKGIHGGEMAAAAVAKGHITEEQAKTMTDKEKVGLIFLPGLSTAERVTDVSGRGVGMDVVKTNLDRMGGQVDVDSAPGTGTRIRIKLPLTLAIIPSQVISVAGERYAVAQVNMDELLRIPAAQVKEKIERVGDAEVVRLRGRLLPLIRLADLLGVARTYVDKDGVRRPDRRQNIADRRSRSSELAVAEGLVKDQSNCGGRQGSEGGLQADNRAVAERRYHASSTIHIVVVSAGPTKYGLVVDQLHDPEEIVVKPLGRHLKHCRGYAGATIMGDGRVALILDVAGLAKMAELTSLEGTKRAEEVAKESAAKNVERQSMLLFRSSPDEQFVAPLALVQRVEKIKKGQIEAVGGKRVMQYRGGSLPLFSIDDVAEVKPLADDENLLVVVFKLADKEVGLLASSPVDAMEVEAQFDHHTLKQPGIMGSAVIGNHTTLLVDIFGLVETLHPDWIPRHETIQTSEGKAATILFAEDSNFFRNQVKGFMEETGYNVIEAQDGEIAWDLLQEQGDRISLIVTDIEMPNLDGFALTERVRGDQRYCDLPVIALTTMAADEDVARGRQVGIDDYLIKLDKERLHKSIYSHLKNAVRAARPA